MKKFAIGFLLIFLNFNLNFNQFSINVLPDFVGYYLLLKGSDEMKRENPRFEVSQPFMVGMIIYTAILWVGAVLGVSGGVLGTVLGIIAQVVHFYIAWVLVQALREMEQNHGADLYGSVLLSRWKIMLGINVAIQLLRVLASVGTIRIVMTIATVLVLAALIWSFLFVLGWNRAANLWEELQAAPAAETGSADVGNSAENAEEPEAESDPAEEE